MKPFLFALIFCLFIVLSADAVAVENEKASFSFQAGTNSSKGLFGANFDLKPFNKNKPLYVGASALFTKSHREDVLIEDYPFELSNTSFFVDFNVGLRPKGFFNRKLVPSIEAGVGFLGNNTSLCSYDFYACFSDTAHSFSKHAGFGLRSYLGKNKGYFLGGKANFYKVSGENKRVILGEIGLAF